MAQPTGQLTPREQRAEASAQRGWAAVRAWLRRIGPGDLARLLLGAVIGLATVWLAVASWPALLPFLLGGFIAYTLLPMVNWLDRVLPRSFAAIVTLAAMLVIAIAVLATIVPALASQLGRFAATALSPEQLDAWRGRIGAFVQDMPSPARELIRGFLERLSISARAQIAGLLDELAAASTASGLALVNTLSVLVGVLLVPLWMFALLVAQGRADELLRQALPDGIEPDIMALLRIADRSLRAFVTGQLTLALAVGAAVYLGFAAAERFDGASGRYKLIAALLAGLLQLIPQVGPIIGVILFGGLSLVSSPQMALISLAVYIGAQIVVGSLVAPHIERRLNDLNPIVLTLFIVALSEFGPLWIFFAAPLMAIARDVVRYAYGRLSVPPLPAGVLPGEPAAAPAGLDRPASPAMPLPPAVEARGECAGGAPPALVYQRARMSREEQLP